MAVFIVSNITNLPKQTWKLPSGCGKSFIIAAVALIAVLKTTYVCVHIVLPTFTLEQREKNDFKGYWQQINDPSFKVQYHNSINFDPSPGSLVLIDEADI